MRLIGGTLHTREAENGVGNAYESLENDRIDRTLL
jgi:hypothetical protein